MKPDPFLFHEPDVYQTKTGAASALLSNAVSVIQTQVGSAARAVTPSQPSLYGYQNLAFHVGDEPQLVHQNRLALLNALNQTEVNQTACHHIVPEQGISSQVKRIHWVNQVHGTDAAYVTEADGLSTQRVSADALITREPQVALAMMTADCLPIVLTDADGTEVAAIHAGWRGLQAGIIAKTVQQMKTTPAYAWIGAAISQDYFEVGQDVYDAFTLHDAAAMSYFKQRPALTSQATEQQNKYDADLSGIAQLYLSRLAIQSEVFNACSFADPRFYSYRQASQTGDVRTGRMATLVWLNPSSMRVGESGSDDMPV